MPVQEQAKKWMEGWEILNYNSIQGVLCAGVAVVGDLYGNYIT